MGLFIHHAFIISHDDKDKVNLARDYAISLDFIVTNVINSKINPLYSFLISPDGSKEFWPESDEFDEKRELMIKFLKNKLMEWVLVEYGECQSKLINSSHEQED